VNLVGAPDADVNITMTKVEEVDVVGGKTIRKIGPMESSTCPLINPH
jgi:hypothetical protein